MSNHGLTGILWATLGPPFVCGLIEAELPLFPSLCTARKEPDDGSIMALLLRSVLFPSGPEKGAGADQTAESQQMTRFGDGAYGDAYRRSHGLPRSTPVRYACACLLYTSDAADE